jgi:two-component system, OmpR family, sensor histidine kinase QseC
MKNALTRLAAHLREPSLVRRGAMTVASFFLLIWAVLLGYQFWQLRWMPANGPGMQQYGNALLLSVDRFERPEQAAAFIGATEQWLNIRRREIGVLPGRNKYELRDLQGQLVYQSGELAGLQLNTVKGQLTEQAIEGRYHRIYTAESGRWTLTVLEPWRTTSEFLVFTGMALLPFLLLAMPFVLVPLWLSVRHGLKPLQSLANRIAARKSDDLNPIGFNARHRELKPLEHALDALLDQLRQKLARERAFVQDAAHELRTPLAVISAQAHVLAGAQDASQRMQSQNHLEQAIARAAHLSTQLLLLAAMDDAVSAPLQTLDVAQWLRQTMAVLAPEAMQRGLDISLDAPDSLVVLLDHSALASVVHNLLDNALRYGKEGGAVEVTLRDSLGGFTLSVQDDGPGITPKEAERVFERFYRGADQTASGSGLGLSIVRQAASRLGGSVRLGAGLRGAGAGFFVKANVSSDWSVEPMQG